MSHDSRTRIHLTIDRLALPPMESADRKALLAALHTELSRALAEPGTRATWARPHRTPVLKLGSLTLAPGPAAARAFGTRLAGAIARGLNSSAHSGPAISKRTNMQPNQSPIGS